MLNKQSNAMILFKFLSSKTFSFKILKESGNFPLVFGEEAPLEGLCRESVQYTGKSPEQ